MAQQLPPLALTERAPWCRSELCSSTSRMRVSDSSTSGSTPHSCILNSLSCLQFCTGGGCIGRLAGGLAKTHKSARSYRLCSCSCLQLCSLLGRCK